MTTSVRSEVGQLRQVIVHRPGLELARLTPLNIGDLLFDDVMWASKAREEHDAFADVLRDRGVQVHHFGQLLTETLQVPEGRAYVLDQVCTPEMVGPELVDELRRLTDDADAATLAGYLIGGVLKADLRPLRSRSLKWEMLRADDFLLTPLPNHLFTRDNSCWVYGGVSVSQMAKPARQRETVHVRAVYRYHPMFAGGSFATWYGGDDASHMPASIEGGDVHVIGNGAVLIGMGERTTPMAVEMLARALFADGQARTVIGAGAAQVARDDAPGHGDDHDRPGHLRALPLLRRGPAVVDHHPRPGAGRAGGQPQRRLLGRAGADAGRRRGHRADHRRGRPGGRTRAVG